MLYRPALMLVFLQFLLIGFLSTSRAAQANSNPSVVFLSPGDTRFWHMVSEFMEEVAADLDLDLEILFDPDGHRYSNLKLAENVLGRESKPDYFVFVPKEQVSTRILKYANEMGVKAFTFNTGVPAATKASVGMPRETLPNWIGHLESDDVAAGRKLAVILQQQSQSLGLVEPGQPLPLLAFSGTLDSSAAKDRQQGLMDAVEDSRINFLQLVSAKWSRQLAKGKSRVLLQRYPQVAAIWSASDGMALGALEAVKQAGKQPGKDVLFGGIDWEPEALETVRSGELAVSLGRHFMGGGLVLLLLHDYHQGVDFSNDRSPPLLSYQLKPATAENVDMVEQIMDQQRWQSVDFRRFSRAAGSGEPNSQKSADELMDEFTGALAGPYSRSASKLPVDSNAGASPDSENR